MMPKKCFNCEKTCTSDDYCYGCKEYVCDTCGIGETLEGHEASAHLEKPLSDQVDTLSARVETLEADLAASIKDLDEAETDRDNYFAKMERLEAELGEVDDKAKLCMLLLNALGLTEHEVELLRPKLELGVLKGTLG